MRKNTNKLADKILRKASKSKLAVLMKQSIECEMEDAKKRGKLLTIFYSCHIIIFVCHLSNT